MPEQLDTAYTQTAAHHIGAIEITLNDLNGTAGSMSVVGVLRILDVAGTVIALRRGDPQLFMPAAWKTKAKQILDELRAEMTTRLIP